MDGHTDFTWPVMSSTSGGAGMETGIVTGYGHTSLKNIRGKLSYIKEQNVWCVGNRDPDPKYEDVINSSKINYHPLHELRRPNGIKYCVEAFLNHMNSSEIQGFWVHVDLDVLNDILMPAVDSREKGRLFYEEFRELLVPVLSNKKCVGFEITILDPELDPLNSYTSILIQNMLAILRDAGRING